MLSVIAGDAGREQQNEVKPHSAVLVLLQQRMELEESTVELSLSQLMLDTESLLWRMMELCSQIRGIQFI